MFAIRRSSSFPRPFYFKTELFAANMSVSQSTSLDNRLNNGWMVTRIMSSAIGAGAIQLAGARGPKKL